MPYLLALFAFFSALAAPGAHAWWNEDWAGRRSVTFAPPEGEATDAPVLVRLHTGNFDFLSAKADGSDLRVGAADDATEP